MKLTECIIVVLRSDIPVRLKKIALADAPSIFKCPNDKGRTLARMMMTHLTK